MANPSATVPLHESVEGGHDTRGPIRIACCVSEPYALPLAVMLSSLVARLDAHARVELHLLHGDLSDSCLDAIGSIVDTHPIKVAVDDRRLIPVDRHFPWEAAAPLLLPTVLPAHIGRVLFIDADMLVLDDISPLWHADLSGRAIGAVTDAAIPLCRSPRGVKRWRERGIPADAPYFNAGVMLMDLRAWRERQITHRAIGYLRESSGAVDFFHQEALNATAWNDWSCLGPRWNIAASEGRPFHRSDSGAACPPALVHFSGRMKPWRFRTGSRFDADYRRALAQVSARGWDRTPRLREQALGLYDRTFRRALYPVERALWAMRVI
jgi:lipopolysaccharide biosynthesis glycosyltransferase